MMELTINGTVYQFKFGMGFLREANKLTVVPVQGMPGTTKEIGARYLIASVVVDQEPNALVDLLDLANKGENPRVTKTMLDSYIDSEEVDIDELMEKTKDFLSKANATKKAVKEILKEYEEQMAKKKAQESLHEHRQAFLNFAVKAEKKAGKGKTKPVYKRFRQFFDFDKELRKMKNRRKPSRFTGITKLLNREE